MNQTVTAIDEIKQLYSQINKKTKWIEDTAKDIGKSPLSLRHHWFAQFWKIPDEYQPRVIELLKTTIKNQEDEKSN